MATVSGFPSSLPISCRWFGKEFLAGRDSELQGTSEAQTTYHVCKYIRNFAGICAHSSFWCCSKCGTFLTCLFLDHEQSNCLQRYKISRHLQWSLAREKSDKLPFMNDYHLMKTGSFVPFMVVHLMNRVIRWGNAVWKTRRGVRLCDCRFSTSSRQTNHWSRYWPGRVRKIRMIMSSETARWLQIAGFLLIDSRSQTEDREDSAS